MSLDTEAIAARLAKITGLPWRVSPCSSGGMILERGPEQPIAQRHRQQFLQIVPEPDGEFIAAAPEDIAALLAEVATLRAALQPFATIAAFHDGDENEDARPVSLVNLVHGGRCDEWYEHGGTEDPFLTRGDLRRALRVLEGGTEEPQQ